MGHFRVKRRATVLTGHAVAERSAAKHAPVLWQIVQHSGSSCVLFGGVR